MNGQPAKRVDERLIYMQYENEERKVKDYKRSPSHILTRCVTKDPEVEDGLREQGLRSRRRLCCRERDKCVEPPHVLNPT